MIDLNEIEFSDNWTKVGQYLAIRPYRDGKHLEVLSEVPGCNQQIVILESDAKEFFLAVKNFFAGKNGQESKSENRSKLKD